MDEYTREELIEAPRVVSSIISKCEKMHLKFTYKSGGENYD